MTVCVGNGCCCVVLCDAAGWMEEGVVLDHVIRKSKTGIARCRAPRQGWHGPTRIKDHLATYAIVHLRTVVYAEMLPRSYQENFRDTNHTAYPGLHKEGIAYMV